MIYVDKTDIAWAAGFFDGEGCIRINKTKNQYILQIFVRQVDPKPIYKFQGVFSVGAINYREKSVDTNENARPIYTWSTAAGTAVQVLKLMYPYLISKNEQADLAIEFQSTVHYTGGKRVTEEQNIYREQTFHKMKVLK
jgi:hypothetical protein